jgi:hypothetical protein
MSREELINKMRGRVDMCRRLAASTTDPKTATILRQMADDGERDIRQLAAEQPQIITPKPIQS